MSPERSGSNYPIKKGLQRPQGLAGAENRGKLSPSWEEILASDGDHEKHLETPEGRFQAVLNIVKNGAMVLEVMAMERNWQDYRDVTRRVNEACGLGVTKGKTVTADHLVRTISTVGAAARSDINDNDWQLTPFGEAIKPVLIYTWQKFLEQGINPAKVLTSISKVKKDQDGNLVDSAPNARAKMLLALIDNPQMKEVELKNMGGISQPAVQRHLKNLKEAGVINLESVDSVDSYTFYTLTAKGKETVKWPVFKDSRGYDQRKLTNIVEQAIVGLALEDKETFTISEILNWIKVNADEPGSARHRSLVNIILTFFSKSEVGILKRSEMNKDNMSTISLTEKGRVFTQEVLVPLAVWVHDANAVGEINTIRANISRNPSAYKSLFPTVARLYRETSPFVNKDRDDKEDKVKDALRKNFGGLTAAEIAWILGFSVYNVRRIVNPLSASGELGVDIGKMGRKRFYLKDGTGNTGQVIR